mmetsp:Transcript_18065/g.36647  ORF Transcript_18065/g.36647 Transcript_18065/m.36647 type:complete len:221 (-) Transcript_18065:667-1329(-)
MRSCSLMSSSEIPKKSHRSGFVGLNQLFSVQVLHSLPENLSVFCLQLQHMVANLEHHVRMETVRLDAQKFADRLERLKGPLLRFEFFFEVTGNLECLLHAKEGHPIVFVFLHHFCHKRLQKSRLVPDFAFVTELLCLFFDHVLKERRQFLFGSEFLCKIGVVIALFEESGGQHVREDAQGQGECQLGKGDDNEEGERNDLETIRHRSDQQLRLSEGQRVS